MTKKDFNNTAYCVQKTLAQAVSFKGVGLHCGKVVHMTLKPASPHEGIYFIRTDHIAAGNDEENSLIKAHWNQVVDTKMCTKIANDSNVSVGTIEHLMAALAGMGIDNLRIEIDGPEVPVMDGSSYPFMEKIRQVGVIDQKAYRRYLKIVKDILVEQGDIIIKASPADDFEVSFHYNIQRLNSRVSLPIQRLHITLNSKTFEEIESARTFGFYEEVEYLKANGLALGGSLENAVVFKEGKVLNPEGFRLEDELVKHKVLDLFGDLRLAGCPILGKIECFSSGHTANNALLKAIFSDPSCYQYIYKSDHSFLQESERYCTSQTQYACI